MTTPPQTPMQSVVAAKAEYTRAIQRADAAVEAMAAADNARALALANLLNAIDVAAGEPDTWVPTEEPSRSEPVPTEEPAPEEPRTPPPPGEEEPRR